MTDKEMLDEVKEKISEIICSHCPAVHNCTWGNGILCDADETLNQILSLKTDACRIAVVMKEGTLPKVRQSKPKLGTIPETLYLIQEYKLQEQAQQDMLSAGYVQEVKGELET